MFNGKGKTSLLPSRPMSGLWNNVEIKSLLEIYLLSWGSVAISLVNINKELYIKFVDDKK